MNTYEITNISTELSPMQKVYAVGFTVVGTDGTHIAEVNWKTPLVTQLTEEEATPEAVLAICEQIVDAVGIRGMVDERVRTKKAQVTPAEPPVPAPELTDAQKREKMVDQVDDAIHSISARFTRFQIEYTEREAAALKFKAAGYEGDPTIWISRFANNVGMSYQAAADLVLAQAAKLRQGIIDLGALRMDKYKITRAETQEVAEYEFNRIISEANIVASTLA